MVVKKLIDYFKLYFAIVQLSLKSRMSFRLNFILITITVFIKEFAQVALLVVVVQRFDNIMGWSMWEIGLVYCMLAFTNRMFASFFGGVYQIGSFILSGEMDSYLLTPRNPLFLINSRNTMIWRVYYNVGILGLLIFCLFKAGVAINIGTFVLLIIFVGSAMLILFSLVLIVSTFAFFVTNIQSAIYILDDLVSKFMTYPMNIYGTILGFIFTFIIPLGFISYYPSGLLLGKTQGVMFSPYLGALTPMVAIIFVFIALRFWRFGIRSYKSTGT